MNASVGSSALFALVLAATPALGESVVLPLDVPFPYETRAGGSPYDLIDRPGAVYLVRSATGRVLAELPPFDPTRVIEEITGQSLDASSPRTPLPPGVEAAEGWPVALPDLPAGSPAIGDLDGDARAEIAVSLVDGNVYVFDAEGLLRAGWPRDLGAPIHHAPRLVDLDQDGRTEIVVGTENGFVHALGVDGGRALPGWPICLDARGEAEQLRAAPAVGDLHPHPGLEVVLVGTRGTVQAFGADGVSLPGWPYRMAPSPDGRPPVSYAPAAIGDLEADGDLEVLIAWEHGEITALDADGRPAPGWPRQLPHGVRACFGGVLAQDLDGGGGLEVLAATDRGTAGAAVLAVLRQDGRALAPWPLDLPERVNGGVAIADLDGDGGVELLVATTGGNARIEARGLDGRSLPGWPRKFAEVSFDMGVIVADLTPDAGLEVAALGSAVEYGAKSLLYLLSSRGETLPGFPIVLEGTDAYDGGMTACDLEGDGRTELVVARGGDARLDVYRFTGGGARPWFRSDLGNEAIVRLPSPPDPFEVYGPPRTRGLEELERERMEASLGGDLPAPLDPESTFRFLLAEPAAVRLRVLDVRGATVRRLLQADLPRGFYAVNWDGLDDGERSVPTGVFFFELEIDGKVDRKQLVLSLR